jgi:hypothetical protein
MHKEPMSRATAPWNTKLESKVCHLGIDVDDEVLKIAEQTEWAS